MIKKNLDIEGVLRKPPVSNAQNKLLRNHSLANVLGLQPLPWVPASS